MGATPLVLAAAVAAAALFAAVSIREWGGAAVWPARVFAVLAAAPVYTTSYPWALGLAFALGALGALQRGWIAVSLVCAALALGASPLAFVFLCLALLAVVAVRRPSRERAVALGGGLAVLAALQVAVSVLFPAEGRYPFSGPELAYALPVVALGAAVAWRAPRGRLIAAVFLLFGLACVLAFVIPSPFGSNVTRFRTVVFPLVLLAASVARFRPRLLALAALAAALVYNATQYSSVAAPLTDTRAAHAGFWAPALEFLRAHSSADYRVDVVPVFDNWEADFVPSQGVPITRGWYRQLDLARNPVLYEESLTAAEYRAWLRSLGARYVVLPRASLDPLAARDQERLLRSGQSGLVQVFETSETTIYELPAATPILTGPSPAGLTALTHERIAGWTSAPGSYVLRIRHTPYLVPTASSVCTERAPDGMTRLEVRRAGEFALEVPGPGTLARIAFGARPAAC